MYELIGIESEKKEEEKKTFEFRPLGKGMQDMPGHSRRFRGRGRRMGYAWSRTSPAWAESPMECAQNQHRIPENAVFERSSKNMSDNVLNQFTASR